MHSWYEQTFVRRAHATTMETCLHCAKIEIGYYCLKTVPVTVSSVVRTVVMRNNSPSAPISWVKSRLWRREGDVTVKWSGPFRSPNYREYLTVICPYKQHCYYCSCIDLYVGCQADMAWKLATRLFWNSLCRSTGSLRNDNHNCCS